MKPEDNLRPEGKMYRPDKPVFNPAERPKAVKPEDNLHPNEGQFQRPEKPKYIPAEKPKQIRPKDNLTTGHGEFVVPEKSHPKGLCQQSDESLHAFLLKFPQLSLVQCLSKCICTV